MTSNVEWPRRRTVLAGLLGMGASLLGSSLVGPRFARAAEPSAADDSAGTEAGSSDLPMSYGPPAWMRIPRIVVDSATVDVGVTQGYYDVPWFEVGHHVDSANPGEPGNSVFNGHVLTIGAGRVFARLMELTPGDAVFVYTATHRTGWAVVNTFAVSDGDDTFLGQTLEPQLTLYTCTGAFNVLERNYAERFVVLAELQEVVLRA